MNEKLGDVKPMRTLIEVIKQVPLDIQYNVKNFVYTILKKRRDEIATPLSLE